ncbi:hypothetical protein DTO96_100614 [Ephemeroptericola cinctiostellae]|uniref:Uncharacterized protein n=1 Tax=Ephemeroptericola cinctiostellae TaxID=2268024 RepID=A0A345D965_9BURK|nr:PP0621 family protein [Ephemeroptericola cinctiostellae]AXF84903.1 hypothetical protein DTO96_100614 [Ephemeroptericola cinctiostellae]
MKLLVILVVLFVVAYALWQKWQRIPPQTKQLWGAIFGMAGAMRQAKKQAKQNGGFPVETPVTNRGLMLPCTTCGLHVPQSEGVLVSGRFYCSAEHVK